LRGEEILMIKNKEENVAGALRTLPGDDVRAIMWRYADRYDLQMLTQSARSLARGPVARMVAEGARNSHEWTPAKSNLLRLFDESGITAAFIDPKYGGYMEGPKNMAMALIAFELAWVDAGAATGSLAGNLGLAPIHERGTEEQKDIYFRRGLPPSPGENRETYRGAFALTEPLPYVGVETGILSGKMRVAEWREGEEPILQVDKRGRFITNMGFANFVTAAVDSDDRRIKGSCMVILEDTDPGVFDRGVPTRKMVHQLSSTSDPIFNLKIPASRIIGGYKVKDGIIIPNCNHGELIEAVFRRTRVTIGLMSAAKLLSAVEPVIRYQRQRFRGGADVAPGSLRYDLGLQQKEDAVHRLVDVWAFGEASASLGFEGARVFDLIDPLEREKDRILSEQKIERGRSQVKALARIEKDALEYIQMMFKPEAKRDAKRFAELEADKLVGFVQVDSLANVLCPACKLWNTGVGATVMREAVALMGGYGITEDCPGFLMNKWIDIQLEATYEGPEAVQRRQMSVTMTTPLFLARFNLWIEELGKIEAEHPGMGARVLACAMRMWVWTLVWLQGNKDALGGRLYGSSRQGASFMLADALCWLLASRQQIADVLELARKGPGNPAVAEGLEGTVAFFSDLAWVQAARAAGEVGRMCAELTYGYRNDSGPEEFPSLRASLDAGLAGARLAKDRAADSLTKVMIPEALDYPI